MKIESSSDHALSLPESWLSWLTWPSPKFSSFAINARKSSWGSCSTKSIDRILVFILFFLQKIHFCPQGLIPQNNKNNKYTKCKSFFVSGWEKTSSEDYLGKNIILPFSLFTNSSVQKQHAPKIWLNYLKVKWSCTFQRIWSWWPFKVGGGCPPAPSEGRGNLCYIPASELADLIRSNIFQLYRGCRWQQLRLLQKQLVSFNSGVQQHWISSVVSSI
jgi:hypothetical protein